MQQENPKMYSSVSNQFTVSPHPHSPLSVSCCKPMVETVKIKVLSVIIVILLINCAIILTNWSGEHRELRDNIGQLGVQCSMQPLLLLFISNTLTFHRHYYCQFNIMPQLPHCRHWPTSYKSSRSLACVGFVGRRSYFSDMEPKSTQHNSHQKCIQRKQMMWKSKCKFKYCIPGSVVTWMYGWFSALMNIVSPLAPGLVVSAGFINSEPSSLSPTSTQATASLVQA